MTHKLEEAKRLYETANADQKYVLESLFPELKEYKEYKDEIIRQTLIRFHKSTIDIDSIKGDEIVAWLEKQGEHKPAWSEEDEVKINRIVGCLENLNVSDNDILLRDVDWLKSLKDRYTWKPSDEQMEALESAVENCAYSEYQDCLRELIGQLKKLKGE